VQVDPAGQGPEKTGDRQSWLFVPPPPGLEIRLLHVVRHPTSLPLLNDAKQQMAPLRQSLGSSHVAGLLPGTWD